MDTVEPTKLTFRKDFMFSLMTIKGKHEPQYRYTPQNSTARKVCQLIEKGCLFDRHIAILEELGFEIEAI
jgi:hypothetical protein